MNTSIIKVYFTNNTFVQGDLLSIDKDEIQVGLADATAYIKNNSNILYFKIIESKKYTKEDFINKISEFNDLAKKPGKTSEDIGRLAEIKKDLIQIEKEEVDNKVKSHEISSNIETKYVLPNITAKPIIPEYTAEKIPGKNKIDYTGLSSLFNKKRE